MVGTLARAYATNFAAQFLTQPYGGFDLVFLRKGFASYYGMWFYAYALTVIGAVVTVRRIGAGGVVREQRDPRAWRDCVADVPAHHP